MGFSQHGSKLFVGLAFAGLLAAPGSAEPQRRIPLQVVEDAGSCRVDDAGRPPEPRGAAALTAEQLTAIKARMLAAVVADGGSGAIPLNGRGYNYRAHDDPTRELLLIQRELESRR